jgi:23S rRNA (guanine2445-N2)-methyltransferase / 23S rRNA (guanine2069-N7)-methyltransferase
MMQFRASSPRGLAQLVALELATFGATEIREHSTDVGFSGSLETAYRACLWSRAANRIFLELAQFEASDAEEFYAGAREIDWPAHIGAETTLACDFSGQHPALTHTHFAALKLKDAICDELRARSGYRPTISTDRPGVRVHAHARGNAITVALDLSGESLHRRGYRHEAGEAPIKENLAAGILLRSGWTKIAGQGEEFLDPMCGSGTLVIEAAMVAADIAPALKREYFGFLRWRQHEPDLWQRLRSEALARASSEADARLSLRGLDSDPAAISRARSNAQAAGVAALTEFRHLDLASATPSRTDRSGLLVTNPPYGIRLNDPETSRKTYRTLGGVLRERFVGWQAAVLCADPRSGLELGIRAYRSHVIWNGAVECRLLRLRVDEVSVEAAARRGATPPLDPGLRASPGAQMFANRLSKNLKRLRAWASRNAVSCYRIYDADMPEYALAIDLYQSVPDGLGWVYVQEYAAPATVDVDAARRRRGEALAVLPDVCGVPVERIRLRIRRKTRPGTQYDRLAEHSDYHVVEENGLRFRVNFDKYLDTGLFLDMRLLRSRLRNLAVGATFLNLFAYTGAATVYAAAAPASATLSIDLSNTYLDWMARNLALNGLQGSQHRLLRANCNDWLVAARERGERFDLIFLAPPTFSNSKRMEGVLDIRRDHVALVDACAALLAPRGTLIFLTSAQRFKLAEELTRRYSCTDISSQTLPEDFERSPKIHRCFEIRPL